MGKMQKEYHEHIEHFFITNWRTQR